MSNHSIYTLQGRRMSLILYMGPEDSDLIMERYQDLEVGNAVMSAIKRCCTTYFWTILAHRDFNYSANARECRVKSVKGCIELALMTIDSGIKHCIKKKVIDKFYSIGENIIIKLIF